MFRVLLLQMCILTFSDGVPCGYRNKIDDKYNLYRQYNAWKCPKDDVCIQNKDVCAPPPEAYPRCPSGGDVGNASCTQKLCNSIGRIKCPNPNDPYCVDDAASVCEYCPHGGENEKQCEYYRLWAKSYAKCETNFKYYSKKREACNNAKNCLDGSDEQGCDDNNACRNKTDGQFSLRRIFSM